MSLSAGLIIDHIVEIIAGGATLSAVILGWLSYNKNNEIKKLEEEKESLKKTVHRFSSKVNPEMDRTLIKEAKKNIQILGINALAPLHHCREELIKFLTEKDGTLEIVLLNPTSSAFRNREQFERDTVRRIYTEWKATLCILKDIQVHSSGHIILKLHDKIPSRALIIFDSYNDSTCDGHTCNHLTDSSKMLINYYPEEPGMRGYMGGQFLSEISLERDRDSFYKNMGFFREVWNTATAIKLDDLICNHNIYT